MSSTSPATTRYGAAADAVPGAAVGPGVGYGIRTWLMTWMTPLDALTSVLVTWALLT